MYSSTARFKHSCHRLWRRFRNPETWKRRAGGKWSFSIWNVSELLLVIDCVWLLVIDCVWLISSFLGKYGSVRQNPLGASFRDSTGEPQNTWCWSVRSYPGYRKQFIVRTLFLIMSVKMVSGCHSRSRIWGRAKYTRKLLPILRMDDLSLHAVMANTLCTQLWLSETKTSARLVLFLASFITVVRSDEKV